MTFRSAKLYLPRGCLLFARIRFPLPDISRYNSSRRDPFPDYSQPRHRPGNRHRRLARSATGEAVFTSDADYTHNSALLKSLPTHLEQINTLIADLVDAALDAALNPDHDAASPDPQF